MNRRFAIVAVVAVLALGAATLVAQSPAGGTQPGQQRMGGPGRGGPGRGGGPGILPGLNHLDLSDAQREQVRAIMESGRQSGDPGEKMAQAEHGLNAALLADVPDPQAIESAKAAVNAAQAALLDRRIDLMQKIAQVLTPAQRQELAQMPGPGRGRGFGLARRH